MSVFVVERWLRRDTHFSSRLQLSGRAKECVSFGCSDRPLLYVSGWPYLPGAIEFHYSKSGPWTSAPSRTHDARHSLGWLSDRRRDYSLNE